MCFAHILHTTGASIAIDDGQQVWPRSKGPEREGDQSGKSESEQGGLDVGHGVCGLERSGVEPLEGVASVVAVVSGADLIAFSV